MDYYEPRDECFAQEVQLDDELSPIQQCFDGAGVLITGTTGFLGTLILEKLLRSCPGIDRVYLLLRPKKDKSPEQRMIGMFEDVVFERLKSQQPRFMSKIRVVQGDCKEPGCGISPDDQETIINNVNFVFHVAAALRMDCHLSDSFSTNVQGTKALLQLSQRIRNLKSFVYVSTAYTHCYREVVHEEIYEPAATADQLEYLLSNCSYEDVAVLSKKLYGKWLNPYAYTKAIAESLVKSYSMTLPVAIVRPAIVIACYKEPFRGWINNIYGATGVYVAAGLGLMRTFYCDKNRLADLVPADTVVNAVIAVAWETALHWENLRKDSSSTFDDDMRVYQVVSSGKAPITWDGYMRLNETVCISDKLALTLFVGLYNFRLQRSYHLYFIQMYLMHLIPGLLTDFVLRLVGKKPRLMNAYIKIHNFNMCLGSYCQRQWVFTQNHLDSLWTRMSPTDQRLFDFDMTDFDWPNYFLTFTRGVRVYLMKDPMENLDKAIARYDRISKIFTGVKIVLLAIVIWMISKLSFVRWTMENVF